MKSRLFVFGDSFAFNYFANDAPKYRPELEKYKFLGCKDAGLFVKQYNYLGHWTDYLNEHFDVINFAEPGCSNEDIIHQLGLLPDYIDDDRIIIMFSNVGRYTWYMSDNKRHAITNGSIWQTRNEKKITKFLEEQIVLRDINWTDTDERKNEKIFYEKISNIYEKYKPIKITWDKLMNEQIPSISLIPYENKNLTTITQESDFKLIDGHLGFIGNYELYLWVSKILEIKEEDILPIYPKPKPNII